MVLEGDSQLEFGTAEADFPVSARVVIHDGAFWEQLAWGGSIGAGESYCDGQWTTPDLTEVVRVLARNQAAMDEFDQGTARITAPFRRLLHELRSNSTCVSVNSSGSIIWFNRLFLFRGAHFIRLDSISRI